MAGVILETVTNKQLIGFTLLLLAAQIAFLVIGGTIAPAPSSAMEHIAHICFDQKGNSKEFFSPWECQRFSSISETFGKGYKADQIVFAVQFPHRGLDMSRWHQFVIGAIMVEIEKRNDNFAGENPTLTLDMRLGAKHLSSSSWTTIAESVEERVHICELVDGFYQCEDLPGFELGSCHYDSYLLNIRLLGNGHNKDIGLISEIKLVEIHQNGGFTKVWFALKTILAPLIIVTVIWFKRRLNRLRRTQYLFEKTIFYLGSILALLNFPFEWLTLWFDIPYMLLISDLRQGLFYVALLLFWLIFAGEHVMDQTQRNTIKAYKKEMVAVSIGGLSLLIFDLCERGVQLSNPFHSIWHNKSGKKAAMGFLIFAAVCACLYFLFFLVMMVRVLWHISGKRLLYSRMSAARRVAYDGAIFRFKFLLAFTIICAALTIAFFIATHVNEAHWKFGDKGTVEISSALIAGIYGLWNIYVFAVLVLYAPSSQAFSLTNTVEIRDDESESSSDRFISQNITTETSVIYSIAGKGNVE